MNRTNHAIFLIFHYSIMVRDTLEYTLEKPENAAPYSVENYKARKQVLTGMLNNPSPLTEFLNQNGETGEKIRTQLNDFIEDVYGDDSTILKVGQEGLRVDKAQSIKIFNYVVGLYETLSDVVNGYLNYAREQKQDEKDFENIVAFNNRFYRGISYMAIVHILAKTYKEFNDAMRESKGNPTPQSNFLGNDLQQLVGFIQFIKEHNPNKDDEEIMAFINSTDDCIKVIGGLEKAPEGTNIFEMLQKTENQIRAYVAAKEPINNSNLSELFASVRDYEAKLQKEQLKAAEEAQ
ncbi:MAG: hypothetical protein HUJ61_01990 [Bacilli bacterium]|nr:hypothetical protein [Bacilli bacterium]